MNVLGDEGIPGVANVGDYATSERESLLASLAQN